MKGRGSGGKARVRRVTEDIREEGKGRGTEGGDLGKEYWEVSIGGAGWSWCWEGWWWWWRGCPGRLLSTPLSQAGRCVKPAAKR